ncbi:Uncharacterized protein Fot_22624 [Forsythia ovata]|uniref:Uncharacterized protein n=1 Tax=Forsythia ovata TaxID=205694 RepID=A0ABD1UY91_9LAMI
MEAIQQLDLKSDEAHEKKGLSENSVYLSKNTDAGLDAPLLLEPPQNEGIIIEVETEYVNKDHELYSSEADQMDSFGCCSCFSFINFFKEIHFRKYEEETADNQTTNTTSRHAFVGLASVNSSPYQHVCAGIIRIPEWNRMIQADVSFERSNLVYDILEEDDLINEFNRPVKQMLVWMLLYVPLEPHQNEGSEADEVDSFGCCSCFSFINFFKGIYN